MVEKDEGLLLTPEQRRDAFDRAEKRWQEARRKEVYEFNTLWEYIVGETSKAQLAKAKPIIRKAEAQDITKAVKSYLKVHPSASVQDFIDLLQFREETRQALKENDAQQRTG